MYVGTVFQLWLVTFHTPTKKLGAETNFFLCFFKCTVFDCSGNLRNRRTSVILLKWLTQIAGLAGQGIELLLVGPLLIAGGGDDEQTTSPSEPAITEMFSPNLSGTLVQQWKLWAKTSSLRLYPCNYCQRVTTPNYGEKLARLLHFQNGNLHGIHGNKRWPVCFRHLVRICNSSDSASRNGTILC